MSFTSEQIHYLKALEFLPQEINNLSELNEKDLLSALNVKRKKVALMYHPDKTGGNEELNNKLVHFMNIYTLFITSLSIETDILKLIPSANYTISPDCIDFRMEEQIDAYFDVLLNQYINMSSDEEKHDLITHNEKFLQWFKWLNEHRLNIHDYRTEAFHHFTVTPSLLKKIEYACNTLVIQLFAEENLDDITYREAIALGLFRHLLVTGKLVSPLKWICLILCGAYNVLTEVATYFYNKLFVSINEDFLNIFSTRYRLITLLMKVTLMIALMGILVYFLPNIVLMTLFSLPLLSRMLFVLANPLNQIIRPIQEYFNISQHYAFGVCGSLIAIAAIALTTLALCTPLSMTLIILINSVSILSLIASGAVLKKLYELSPSMAIISGTIMACALLITLCFAPASNPETIVELVSTFLAQLSSLGVNLLAYIFLDNIKAKTSELYSTMPFPEEAASENVKDAIKDVPLKHSWSHTLFHTPEQEITYPAPNPCV